MVWAVPPPVMATTVASLFGFLTALAGFWLKARLTWKRQQEATALQVVNVRILIACEIDHNLHVLKTYLDALNSSATLKQPYEGTSLIDPRYSQDAYQSHLSAMPLALGTEKIRAVFKFYSELESYGR